SRLASHAFPQRIMDTLPRAVLLPETEVMKGNAIRRQIVRQGPPRAAIARHVEDRIEDFAATVLGRTPAGLGLGNPRLDASPLFVREVGWVWHPFHTTQFNHSTGIHPRPLFGQPLTADVQTSQSPAVVQPFDRVMQDFTAYWHDVTLPAEAPSGWYVLVPQLELGVLACNSPVPPRCHA